MSSSKYPLLAAGTKRSSSSSSTSSCIVSMSVLLLLSTLIHQTAASIHTTSSSNSINSSSSTQQHMPTATASGTVLVVGSVNVDVIMEVHRLPGKGETTIARRPTASVAVGGKGANQAVAAARLSLPASPHRHRHRPRFICRFGNDSYAAMLERELTAAGVDVSGCQRVPGMASGQGMVLLEADGSATSVVLGGANTAWRERESLSHLLRHVGVVLLQREIPDHVNVAVARAARLAEVAVIQDVGGEERPLSDELLSLLDYVVPNEPELQRLTGMPTETEQQVVAAAATLIRRGARHVLVTLGARGAVLIAADGAVLRQAALPVPGGDVVDATAAGDAFRAAFAVALIEGHSTQHCLQFAAAAGALTVSKLGAVPSLPTRSETDQLIKNTLQHNALQSGAQLVADQHDQQSELQADDIPVRIDHEGHQTTLDENAAAAAGDATQQCFQPTGSISSSGTVALTSRPSLTCPFKFASRLNSMKARRDLVNAQQQYDSSSSSSDDVLGWIQRQGLVEGLELVDLNYPQHLEGTTTDQILTALNAAKLQAGAVCIRFPTEFYAGAFTNPDSRLRQKAVDLAVSGCQWAAELGASELVVWSPYDGYDYHFQVDYNAAWQRTVAAFQALTDGCPTGIKVSLEFKPTDELTRFAIVPSTGAALLLAQDINRPNFGLTLDVGHLLMAGENPAQSVAMVAAAGKLFGVQLNDAHVKLGAEDGLAFGSVNPVMSLELVRWLQKSNFSGHIYFDTFPLKEDPVREAAYNIRRFKGLWTKAARLAEAGIDRFAESHDAMGVLEFLETDGVKRQPDQQL